MIKYKGQTSTLLTDLCRELNISVDLKASEEILKSFFEMLLKELPADKAIDLICSLPACLKPFCSFQKKQVKDHENGIRVNFLNAQEQSCYPSFLPGEAKTSIALKAILSVLTQYVSPAALSIIYTGIPEEIFYGIVVKKSSKIAV